MTKKLIIDLDDTISTCHDRDWPNARPNVNVIRKINKLYNEGWDIEIFSSRGQLSKTNYFDQVTYWLTNNGVLYTSLTFGKPLGTLYVDDKACSPIDFVNMEIEYIKSWSGSELMRIGGRIHKTDLRIADTLRWYKFANQYVYTPEILAVTGNELVMEYIKPKRPATFADAMKVVSVLSRLDLEPLTDHLWIDYINRISAHLEDCRPLNRILYYLMMMDCPKHGFSHGDLTPHNIVVNRKNNMVLIDPLLVTYSSPAIDQAKVIAWGITHEPEHLTMFQNTIPAYKQYLVTPLVVSELIRTIKYAPNIQKNQITDICLQILNTFDELKSSGLHQASLTSYIQGI